MPKKNTVSIHKHAQSLCNKGEHRKLVAWVEKHTHKLQGNQLSHLYMILAHSCYRVHDYPQGVIASQTSIHANPANAESWYYMGLCLWKLKNIEQSLACYQKALKLNPEKTSYQLNAAMVLRDLGRHQQAIPLYENLLTLDPQSRIYLRNKISATHYTSLDNPDFKVMQKVLQNPLSHADDKMQAYFGLVKMHIDCGDYTTAQTYAIEGNRLRSKIFAFSQNTFRDHIDSIISSFTDVDWSMQSGLSSSKPIFIVGLSRSGKSLLESLLSQSNVVYPKHECCFMGMMMEDACRRKPQDSFYPKVFQNLLQDKFSDFSKEFYRLLCYGVDSKFEHITDTTPQNAEHLGLLRLMYPNAKFIYCTREPMDNYVRIFLKYYFKGNSHANNMQDIEFFDGQIQKLMRFWKESCGIEFFNVSYEKLVTSPQETLQEVTHFLGIEPWDFELSEVNSKEVGFAKHFPELCEPQAKSSKRLGL